MAAGINIASRMPPIIWSNIYLSIEIVFLSVIFSLFRYLFFMAMISNNPQLDGFVNTQQQNNQIIANACCPMWFCGNTR